MFISDLHIHSRFSRATSRDCDLSHLDFWARRKGIKLVGTGDFTHPAWRAELRDQLVPAEEGLYTLRPEYRLPGGDFGEEPRFVVTGEISSIYKRDGKTRKVHNLILLPNLEAADELAAKLEAIGNIRSDGRPILGLDSRDLLQLMLDTCPEAELVPAHIWTPHFSMLGAFSGFDTVEECFGELTPYIHGLETGLSSDPPMNWRVSQLDGLSLLSHSDAHSPAKLGREANLMDTILSYPGLMQAIRTGEGLLGTIEFFPEEGKYHLDGHRACNVCLEPSETLRLNGRCPVCGRKLTIGVEHRVEALADRSVGFRPEHAKSFESLAPLPEVIAASLGGSAASKKAVEQYERLLAELGSEFYILRSAPLDDVEQIAGPCVAEGLRRLRAGKVERRPGFDGEYGQISLLSPAEREQLTGQLALFKIEASVKKTDKKTLEPRNMATEKKQAIPTAEVLNPRQEQAAFSADPYVAVVAGPGTGKTKTLVARIAYLIEDRGVRPEEITAVTFTNQAAAEMRQRLEKRLGGKRAVAKMTIGTFHAICLSLLGNVRLVGRGEALTLAGNVLRETGASGKPQGLLQAVSRIKNGASLEDVGLDNALFTAYNEKLRGYGMLDFDDLLTEALRRDLSVGRRCFNYLLVDEFQDINDTQYALVREWSRNGKSLFVIGDPDQAIYGFRGAMGRCFARLAEDIPALREIRLTENYRSAPEILCAAQSVIEVNPGGSRALNPNRPAGSAVRLVQAGDDFDEGIWIAKEIARMTGGIDMLEAQKQGMERESRAFSEIAVLCRTHRQLELIEKCLRHDDIPCIVTGREDYLESDEVRAVLAFFQALQMPEDAPALETSLRLLFDTPADLIEKFRQLYGAARDLETLQQELRGFGHLEQWLERAAEWKPLLNEKPRVLIARWEERYGSTPALERLRNTAVFYPDWAALWNALTLGQEADISREVGKSGKAGAVRLMTLHASKGLEFPAVLLAGLKSGVLPPDSSDPAQLEEERRLFYVGMTRAQEELILSAPADGSPFLDDLPQSVLHESAGRRERPAEQLTLF